MTPASMCTLSFSTSLRALVSAAAGWPSLSSRMTSSFRPPACQPVSCQYSSHALYMSLPAAAMAPDRGEMKPILIGPWAAVSPATSAASDTATSKSRSEEHTSELQSHHDLVCRLLLEKKKNQSGLEHLQYKNAHLDRLRSCPSDSV